MIGNPPDTVTFGEALLVRVSRRTAARCGGGMMRSYRIVKLFPKRPRKQRDHSSWRFGSSAMVFTEKGSTDRRERLWMTEKAHLA